MQNQVTCVVFLAAIDEFDTYILTENNQKKNKLVESIEVFKEIQNSQSLSHVTFILFLNKVDVFKEKIQTSDLIDHFDNFPGNSLTYSIRNDQIKIMLTEGFNKDESFGLKFLRNRFLNANLDKNGKPIKTIYSHETTATGLILRVH